MARVRQGSAEALLEQSRTVSDWLRHRPISDFTQQSVLPGWDVRQLTGHLVMLHEGLGSVLAQPTRQRPHQLADYVQHYRPNADQITALTAAATGTASGPELVDRLDAAVDTLTVELGPDRGRPAAVLAPRGPLTLEDFLASRIIEVVVHADDLSRSLSDAEPVTLHRGAVARCSRALVGILADRHPGRSVEVRIPPYAAVQCAIGDPGPTHTRGTPPNVVETDALTFLRLATGRTPWPAALATGKIHASGLRADLTPVLPLL